MRSKLAQQQVFLCCVRLINTPPEASEFSVKRFLCIYRGTPAQPAGAEQTTVVKLFSEMASAGVLLAAEQSLDAANGVRLRARSGDVVVAKQPQLRDCTSGVILMQARSQDEVVGWNKRIIEVFRDGECEICEVAPPPQV